MKLSISLILATIMFSAPLAHAGVAYYKPQSAATDSAEGKKNASDEKADLNAKLAEIKKASDEATAEN